MFFDAITVIYKLEFIVAHFYTFVMWFGNESELFTGKVDYSRLHLQCAYYKCIRVNKDKQTLIRREQVFTGDVSEMD